MRQVDPLFRLSRYARGVAQQPLPQPMGIFQPDAAGAEVRRVGLEQVPFRGIVQIDAVLVGELVLDVAHGIGAAGILAQLHLDRALGHRVPVELARIEHLRIGV